ncbi:MAG: AAA family ATPase, partial [Candidatus Krumholzibacteriia bacterium]
MKTPRHSAIERILDRQARLWESQSRTVFAGATPRPANLAISQRPYSGASDLARLVAERIGWQTVDRQILEALHENDELGKSVLESLDERLLNYREDWLYHLFVPGHMSSTGYVRRLSQLILSLAVRGSAIFIGRGTSFIIPPEHRLAVLVVRSLDSRLGLYRRENGGTPGDARRALSRLDRERGEFVTRSFHHQVDDPQAYDLCVNL